MVFSAIESIPYKVLLRLLLLGRALSASFTMVPFNYEVVSLSWPLDNVRSCDTSAFDCLELIYDIVILLLLYVDFFFFILIDVNLPAEMELRFLPFPLVSKAPVFFFLGTFSFSRACRIERSRFTFSSAVDLVRALSPFFFFFSFSGAG